MKRLLVIVLMGLAVPFLAFGQTPPQKPGPGGKVLVIIRDVKLSDPVVLALMITNEAGVMREILRKAGYQVEVGSLAGESWGTPPHVLKADRKLSAVNVTDYRGVVIPCLGIMPSELHPDLAAAVESAVAKGKPVAAQNGGVEMLAKAGVLSGRKYAASDVAPSELRSGIYSGSGVVQDGRIITSGMCPGMAREYRGVQDGTPRLMEMLIAELKLAK